MKHGFSGKKLAGKAERPVLNRRIEAFSAEAGESSLLQGAAGFAALAMTQAEAICESRHLSAEEKSRRIRRNERGREADMLEDAEKLLAAGNHRDGFARLAETPRGCMRISGQWLGLVDRAAALPPGQPIGPALGEDLDRLRSTIPPEERSHLSAILDQRKEGNALPAGRLHQLAMIIAGDWEEAGIQLREDWDQALEARLSNARADLGPKGQLRHRYFQSAQSNYRQMVQLIQRGPLQAGPDRPESPERNEPEDSPQALEMEAVLESDMDDTPVVVEGQADHPLTDDDEPSEADCDVPVRAPAARNEPEDSSEALSEPQVSQTASADLPEGELPNVLTPMILQALKEEFEGEPEEDLAEAIREANALLFRNGARPAGPHGGRPMGRQTIEAPPVQTGNANLGCSRANGTAEGPSSLANPTIVGDTGSLGSPASEKSQPRPEAPR